MTTLHQSLGRYLIEAEIGRGAMGVVYRAYDPQLGRTVAIKTISLSGPEFSNDQQEYRARFFREARAAGRLSHPGIVTIFDVGEDSGSGEPYLVMEHISGEPLSRVLTRTRKLPLSLALQYAQEIAEALDYAHTQGVVHRDIKPQNILITEDGHAKIADFGVAWLNQEIGQAGEVVGSPAFMAPEQMAGKKVDARSDLFSLGVVLYTMLTGFRPFQGNSSKTVVFKVMNIEPVPVTSFQSDIPPELNAIVARAIAKNPDERYPSGAALVRDLKAFREADFVPGEAVDFFSRPVQNGPNGTDPRFKAVDKKRLRLALVIAVLSVAFAGSVFSWRMSRIREVPLSADVVNQLRLPAVPKLSNTTANVIAGVARPVKHKLKRPRLLPTAASLNSPDVTVNAAKLQVEIHHHFSGAKASIWWDDKLISEQNLKEPGPKHSLLRSVEINQVTNFKLEPGKHWLQVRVVSAASKYDQVDTIEAELLPGSEHVLSVDCDKHQLTMTLQEEKSEEQK